MDSIVKLETWSLEDLMGKGWYLEHCHLGTRLVDSKNPDSYIREELISSLGQEVEVTPWEAPGYFLDVTTGYLWPESCFPALSGQAAEMKKAQGCECGAKFTSFPHAHLSYCQEFKPLL